MPFFIHTRPTEPKMPLFQRQCYGPDPAFAPLVRLLNDWDAVARESAHQHRRHHTPTPSFVPKFDVIETDAEYQLHGELGGLAKKDVNIEFTDEHTLVVKGRVEKSYKPSTTTPAAAPETAPEAAAEPIAEDDITESTIIDVPNEKAANHHATVSDEEDEDEQDSAAIKALQQQKQQQEQAQSEQQQVQEQKPQEPTYKYWLAERSVGEFTRVFKFPGRVERDGVTASLENGILTVTVPKAKKLAVREIPIF